MMARSMLPERLSLAVAEDLGMDNWDFARGHRGIHRSIRKEGGRGGGDGRRGLKEEQKIKQKAIVATVFLKKREIWEER